jgi:hypothetical protein
MKPVVHLADFRIEHAEAAIAEPADAWPGRCFEIASRLVASGVLDAFNPSSARAVYGHYLGDVSPSSRFYDTHRACGFSRHGWVALPGRRLILDPTRWVFECVEPYIYYGPPRQDYDEGGNDLRRALRPPCPPHVLSERRYVLGDKLSANEWRHVAALTGHIETRGHPRALSRSQIFWLANLSVEELQPHAKALYAAMQRHGMKAFIPIDNLRRVQSGDL